MGDAALRIEQTGSGLKLQIKVVPGASRQQVVGILDGALKVAVSSPPEKGKANRALLKLLARKLRLPVQNIQLVKGESSPHKVLLIEGLSASELGERLDLPV